MQAEEKERHTLIHTKDGKVFALSNSTQAIVNIMDDDFLRKMTSYL